MVWFFLAVVLSLLVYHPGFRKVAVWLTGAAITVVAIILVGIVSHEHSPATATLTPQSALVPVQRLDPPVVTGDPDLDAVLRDTNCEKMKKKEVPFDPDFWLHC
jgi:hypothetical protein